MNLQKKDTITKLSRVGNYTREQWYEIYVRDYFATYLRKAKKDSIHSKDLYNFFVWNKIYDKVTTKQENEFEKTNNHYDTLAIYRKLQEISQKTKDFSAVKSFNFDDLTNKQVLALLKPYYDNWYRTNFKEIMKKFFSKKTLDSADLPEVSGVQPVEVYVYQRLVKYWNDSLEHYKYSKNKTAYNKNKYFDLFVKNSLTTQKQLWEWFKTKNIFNKDEESGYDQAIKLYKTIKNIDPQTNAGRYILDTFKLNQLIPHLQKMFPLANLNFDESKFDKWLDDTSLSEKFTKEIFKGSQISENWRRKANQRAIDTWLDNDLKNQHKLWKLPEFKEAIESWIKDLVGLEENIKPIDDLLSHIDLYYWAAKDSKEYEFLFDDFKNTSAKDKAFEKWVSNYDVVYKITNGIYKKTTNPGIFQKHLLLEKISKIKSILNY